MSEAQVTTPVEGVMAHSQVLRFAAVPATLTPNGTDRRVLAQHELTTGEWVRVHESIAPAAAAASDLHVIHHSELIVVVQGTLGFDHDGVQETAGAGDVIYVAHGTNHRVRNAGDGAARYVVISIGGDVKK